MPRLPFVRRLPAASGGTIGVDVAEIPRPLRETGRCGRWMDLVHTPHIATDPTRTDRAWDWRRRIPLIAFGGGFARRPRLFQLHTDPGDFPLGMIALLENERAIGDEASSAVFVWYLAGAPEAAVQAHGNPRAITTAVLDIAIQVGLHGQADGRLWLHADPGGGDRLLDWYQAKGLEMVPQDTTLPGPAIVGRPNDGRYFRLDEARARRVAAHLAEWR